MSYKINGKTYTDNPMVDEIVYYLKIIMDNIIIKFSDIADKYETEESIKQSDIYISLKNNIYSYEMFTYGKDWLSKIVELNLEEINYYAEFNNAIPEKYHDRLLQIALNNFKYEEYNDYYRRLYGLPDYGLPGLYLSESDIPNSIKDSIDISIPIHEYTEYQIGLIENEGILKRLQSQYPDLDYLNHLGSKRIDPYDSRTAKKFEILYIPANVESLIEERFREVYEKNRIIYMKRHYSPAYKYQNDHYDQFFAIMLISQTVTDIIAEIPEWYVRRDVFDARTVEYMLTSHGVPYYQEIPLKYQISLVRQLNKIIKYKSTNKNLKDLAAIFDYNADISKYFLLKTRKVDDNGNYVDIDKDNLSNSYDLVFVKAGINDTLVDSINENTNIEQYDVVTTEDPYWDGPMDHEYVKQTILSKDFTYETTKYMGLNVTEKASDFKFELAYFLNILFNNNIDKSKLNITIPIIDLANTPCNIIDLFVFMYIISFEYFDDVSDDVITREISNRATIDYGPNVIDDYYSSKDLEFDGQTSIQTPILYNADGGTSSIIYKSIMVDGNENIVIEDDEEKIDISENPLDTYDIDWYYDTTISKEDIDYETMFDDLYDINILDSSISESIISSGDWNSDNTLSWGESDDGKWERLLDSDPDPNKWDGTDIDPNIQWNGKEDSLKWQTVAELVQKSNTEDGTAVYTYMNIDLSDKVLGFNLSADLNYISDIISRPHFSLGFMGGYTLKDLGISKFTTCTDSIIDSEQLIDIYTKNKECYYNLRDLIINANNEHERVLFTFVFEYLFTTTRNDDYFTLKNGEKATSYKQFLADKNKILYDYLDYLMMEENAEIRRSNLSSVVDQIIDSIDVFLNCPDLKCIYSGIAPRSWSVIFGYLKLLIGFFKSYKVTFFEVGINTVYDDEVENNAYINDIPAGKFYNKSEGTVYNIYEEMSEKIYEYTREDTSMIDDQCYFNESYIDKYYMINGGKSKEFRSYLDMDGNNTLSGGFSNTDKVQISYIDANNDIEDSDLMDGGTSSSDMYVELGVISLDGSNSIDHTEPDIVLYENLEWDGGTSSFLIYDNIYNGGKSKDQPYYYDWGNFENYYVMPDEIKIQLVDEYTDQVKVKVNGLSVDIEDKVDLYPVFKFDEYISNFTYYYWNGLELEEADIDNEETYLELRDSVELFVSLQERKILTDIHLYARNIREWIDADNDRELAIHQEITNIYNSLPSNIDIELLKEQLNSQVNRNNSIISDEIISTDIERSITWKTIT